MKKKLIILVSCISVLLISIIVVLAAYTSRSYVKGVATTPNQGFCLSSDYLSVVAQNATAERYSLRKILMDEKDETDDTPYVFSFYIQNSSDGIVNERSVQYVLKVEGLPEGATITRNGADITTEVKGTGSTSPVMPAYSVTIHSYQVSIPKDKMEEAREITIKAIPDDDSDSSGNMLAAIIQPSVTGIVAGFTYKGVFLDENEEKAPYEYAAFNYEVFVYNAAEEHTMLLTWDNTKLEIDPLFLDSVGAKTGNSGNVEFKMDSTSDSFFIKFYRLEGRDEGADWQKSWTNLKEIVSFKEKE